MLWVSYMLVSVYIVSNVGWYENLFPDSHRKKVVLVQKFDVNCKNVQPPL